MSDYCNPSGHYVNLEGGLEAPVAPQLVGEFREAAEKLRAGYRTAVFPPGCFPPRLTVRYRVEAPAEVSPDSETPRSPSREKQRVSRPQMISVSGIGAP